MKNFIKKHKTYLIEFGVIVFIAFSSLSLAFAKHYIEEKNAREFTEINKKIAQEEFQNKINPTKKNDLYKLTLNINSQELVLIEDNIQPKYHIFNDFIYLNPKSEDQASRYLERVNLKNGERELLVEPTNRNRIASNVMKYYQINNDLIITMSGYLEESRTFIVDGETNEFRYLEDNAILKIKKINGKHYAIGSFGDGCGGNVSYSSINLTDYSTDFIKEFGVGCAEGPEEIRIIDNKILFAERKQIENNTFNRFEYSALKTIDLEYPYTERVVFANLPSRSSILNGPEKVYIVSDYLWEYDLSSNNLYKVLDIPDIFNNKSISLNRELDSLCVYTNTHTPYRIMISDGSYALSQCDSYTDDPYHNNTDQPVGGNLGRIDYGYDLKYYINEEESNLVPMMQSYVD